MNVKIVRAWQDSGRWLVEFSSAVGSAVASWHGNIPPPLGVTHVEIDIAECIGLKSLMTETPEVSISTLPDEPDGKLVGSVELQPEDGIVVIRIASDLIQLEMHNSRLVMGEKIEAKFKDLQFHEVSY
jgi:hypothetical protein